jgi:8-amino-7-oxononanoate synthase
VFEAELEKLRHAGLLRTTRDRQSRQGRTITIDGKEYLNFSSNDYLGLSSHPAITEAAKEALGAFGFGSGASRLLGGGCTLHGELEKRLAEFKGTEAALLLGSGYGANTGIIPAIAGTGAALFSDELNHASIIDGCRLSKARTYLYRHCSMKHLESMLEGSKANRNVVITDTVFSMDGDMASLIDLYNLCKRCGATLYLDDAHGTGVLGKGRGALSHFGIKPEPWIIQMGTMSKAMGSFGAFAAGTKDTIEWLRNSARSFIYSTALPAPAAAASLAAIEIIENDPTLTDKLWANRDRLMAGLKGVDTGNTETPVIPVILGDVESALKLSGTLYEKGIHAPAIRPPTVVKPRIRLTVTAAHTEEDIERVIAAINSAISS